MAGYLVGVSGGCDSVALLHQLVDLGYKKFIVCHLNHQLRGQSSDADARFVQSLVARYNKQIVGQARRLPLSRQGKRTLALQQTISILSSARQMFASLRRKKISTETAAREARYSFFARVAKRVRCRKIFWLITLTIWSRQPSSISSAALARLASPQCEKFRRVM